MITRKVSPPTSPMLVGDPIFCGWFSKKGKWAYRFGCHIVIFIHEVTKKAPVQRGFFSLGIVSTGELEGRQDDHDVHLVGERIVSTGELEGRQDLQRHCTNMSSIVSTGELEGRQDGSGCWAVGVDIVSTGELEGRQDFDDAVDTIKLIVSTGELEGRQDSVWWSS